MSVAPSRLRALETARVCAGLGARLRTIACLTGLEPGYILRSVYTKERPAPKGRPSYSEEFYFRAATRVQAAASLLASRYRALVSEGFLPTEALIAGFRHLGSICPMTPLSFDEAFYLIANLDGIWAASRTLALTRCPRCGQAYVAPESVVHYHRLDGCPICRADWASRTGAHKIRATPIEASRKSVAQALPVERDIARAKLLRLMDELGAGRRVAAVLSENPRVAMFRAPPDRTVLTTALLARPLALHKWSANTHVTDRVQFAICAVWYRNAQHLGVPRAEALCGAVARMRTACHRFSKQVTFDRCFEVASLLVGAWGVETPRLELLSCGTCGARFLRSLDEAHSTPCPFCALIRQHRTLQ